LKGKYTDTIPSHLWQYFEEVDVGVGQWARANVTQIKKYTAALDKHIDDINGKYRRNLDDFKTAEAKGADLVQRETEPVASSIKEVEILAAKFQYELDTLATKIDDLEASVAAYGRMVTDLEDKLDDFEATENEKKGALRRLIGFLFGWVGGSGSDSDDEVEVVKDE